MPRAWIYSRVSTQRQVPGLSLDAQEERARARAAADGHTDAQVVRDAGVSGRSMDRPGHRPASYGRGCVTFWRMWRSARATG
jgi:DNA invertase Pin-like site-specific DNA recombinase